MLKSKYKVQRQTDSQQKEINTQVLRSSILTPTEQSPLDLTINMVTMKLLLVMPSKGWCEDKTKSKQSRGEDKARRIEDEEQNMQG